MENLNYYNHRVSVSFNSYLQGHINLDQLIQQLQCVEVQLRKDKSQGSLWFKFSQDDSLATTIPDLQKDLSEAKNREFTMERMSEAINLKMSYSFIIHNLYNEISFSLHHLIGAGNILCLNCYSPKETLKLYWLRLHYSYFAISV